MVARSVDAVVVGAGPNGLVAANALVDAGWDVVLVEAADEVGGAVRTAEVTAPGYRTDLFSAFYPLAAASPVIRDLELDRHGLVWRRAPAVLAHALDLGFAVAALTLLILLWSVCATYWGPLFVDQPSLSAVGIARASVSLVWRRPEQTLATWCMVAVAWVVGVISIGGLVLIVPMLVVILQTHRYLAVSRSVPSRET